MNTNTAFVYKWIHTPTGMWYIGSRTAKGCHPDDGYICSSKRVKPLILQNQSEWKREIIHTGPPDEMIALEALLLESVDAKNDPQSYNQHNGDGKFIRTGVEVSEETRKKRSESNKKNHPGRGKPSPTKGKVASEETRKKQSLAKLGKKRLPFSDETRKKIGDAKRGANNPHYGKPLSDEVKQKLSAHHKGKKKQEHTCPHCGKVGGGGSMIRFHFDNCKHKGKQNDTVG